MAYGFGIRYDGKFLERCSVAGEVAWQVEDDKLTTGEEALSVALPKNAGLLATTTALPLGLDWMRPWFAGVRFVPAGFPRREGRGYVFLARSVPGPELDRSAPDFLADVASLAASSPGPWRQEFDDSRLGAIAALIANWLADNGDKAAEFLAVLQRVGVSGTWLLQPWRFQKPTPGVENASLTYDGTDIGMLSDGTLRAVEMLVALVDDATSVLLVEEPETGIHPGLLRRILAEFDAHAGDKQIIVSTHSPTVVSWARPDELRLVQWHNGKPVVRALSEDESRRAAAYLDDQGDLGAFVFDGGLDEP